MPNLRGLGVRCRNVDDAALARLPRFPSFRELMPMHAADSGFRHIGRCENLEALWCMYCRGTGDGATGHISGLSRLKTYCAGKTGITDRSLEMLSKMHSLEHIDFWQCAGVTDRGVDHLRTLPNLQEISLKGFSGVTRKAADNFPPHMRVHYAA